VSFDVLAPEDQTYEICYSEYCVLDASGAMGMIVQLMYHKRHILGSFFNMWPTSKNAECNWSHGCPDILSLIFQGGKCAFLILGHDFKVDC